MGGPLTEVWQMNTCIVTAESMLSFGESAKRYKARYTFVFFSFFSISLPQPLSSLVFSRPRPADWQRKANQGVFEEWEIGEGIDLIFVSFLVSVDCSSEDCGASISLTRAVFPHIAL